MSKQTVTYEIKLSPSITIILGALTLAVCVYVFAPFAVRDAEAGLVGDAA